MAIKEALSNKVKQDATASIVKAKARAAQINAHAHVLKAKQMINKSKK